MSIITMTSMSDLVGWALFVGLLGCAFGAFVILIFSEMVYRVIRRFVRKNGND